MSRSPLEGVRLVALDLDGTLLPSHKRLSARAKDVIRDLGAAGIAVTIATGRGWNSASAYAAELGLATPVVAFEGALVALPPGEDAPDRRLLHHATLPTDLIRRAVAALEDLHLGFFVCTDDDRTVASRRVLAERRDQIAIWDPNLHFAETWAEAAARGYVLHFVGAPDVVHEGFERLRALGLDGVEWFHADFWDGYDQLQVRPAGIGKDAGLRHVLAHLGLGPEHVLACGDWRNDLGMLRMARVAVAPANAIAEVRAVAHHVLPGTCDDDAVVRFLGDALAR